MAWIPAGSIVNGDLELPTAAQAYLPFGWILTENATVWSYAAFDCSSTGGAETFDGVWSANETTYWIFTLGVTLALGTFDVATPEDVEDFEEEWSSDYLAAPVKAALGDNENTEWEMSPTLAVFDVGIPEPVEDFEEEWNANENTYWLFTPGVDLTIGLFDAGVPEAVEDFEEEWNANENTVWAFTPGVDLIIGLFDAGITVAETFDVFRNVAGIPAVPGTNSPTHAVGPEKPWYFEVVGVGWNATYQLQCQRTFAGPWITVFEFSANTFMEIQEGYINARVHCVAFVAGPPTCNTHWERQDLY